jgi:hypothetical protein
MFGAKIADYIYTLETQTTGSGVTKFKEIFYKDYYAFTLGGSKVSVASVNNDDYPYASVNWQDEAGTVYGGVLDVTTGVLTVEYDSSLQPITPYDVQLTPTAVTARAGDNNVFADTGDTTVQFKDSIQHYIDQRV